MSARGLKICLGIIVRIILYSILLTAIVFVAIHHFNFSPLLSYLSFSDGNEFRIKYDHLESNFYDLLNIKGITIDWSGKPGDLHLGVESITLLLNWIDPFQPVADVLLIGPTKLEFQLSPDAEFGETRSGGEFQFPREIIFSEIRADILITTYKLSGILSGSMAKQSINNSSVKFQGLLKNLEVKQEKEEILRDGAMILRMEQDSSRGEIKSAEVSLKWAELDMGAISREWQPDRFYCGGRWEGTFQGSYGSGIIEYLDIRMNLLKPGGTIAIPPAVIIQTIQNIRESTGNALTEPIIDAICAALQGAHYSEGSIGVSYEDEMILLEINLKTVLQGQPYLFEIKYDIFGASTESILALIKNFNQS